MADTRIVKEWLSKADDDFAFADTTLRGGNTFYAQLCFHFQQSAEKYLKALIIAKNMEFEKVHNLVYLLKTCQKIDPSLATLFDECELLNSSYIDTRYPVHWPTNYTRERAHQAREAALKIGESVKKMLTETGEI
jgi:HEPN domain-containing protein